MSDKPRPIPVKVPWQVCPSTPFLRLTLGEDPSDCPTKLSFLAFCPSWLSISPYNSNLISVPTNQELADVEESGDCIIELTFIPGGWGRMYRSHSDLEIIDESLYDWSAVGYYRTFEPKPDLQNWGEDIFEECVVRFKEEWRRTSICPDPRMYKIENSSWLQELSLPEDRLHFLILGHDAYVEILASDWKWEYVVIEKGYSLPTP